MAVITIVGNVNIETTVQLNAFPFDYTPTTFNPFGISSSVSAVGYNITKALSILGNTVRLCSIIGNDLNGQRIKADLEALDIPSSYMVQHAKASAQSIVFYDNTGRRAVITDLKDVSTCVFPETIFKQVLKDSDLVAMTNITYSKPLLAITQSHKKIIATDIHTIQTPFDAYNLPFLHHATILFLSGELLEMTPDELVVTVFNHFPTQIIVIGLGARGSYLAVRDTTIRMHVPAVFTRPVVQTGGAGDALFAAFLHVYLLTKNPMRALRAATVFASYKIGTATSSEGFLTYPQLEELVRNLSGET